MSVAADLDIFSLGRGALDKARVSFDGRAFFASARRLQADGSWSGPADATCSLADEEVAQARGGLSTVCAAGANTLLGSLDGSALENAVSLGLRVLVRVPFAADEPSEERRERLARLSALLARIPSTLR